MDQSGHRDAGGNGSVVGTRGTLTKLRVLDMDINVSHSDVSNLFIGEFQSPSLLEEYPRSLFYVADQLKGADIDGMELHRVIVRLSEEVEAVDINLGKKDETSLYTSWMLSFTAPQIERAQLMLEGCIQYISVLVVKETLESIRNKLSIKISYKKERLEVDRVKLENQLKANIQRLNYSLEIANTVGIKKSVRSNGQVVKGNPDFSVSLGADGIERRLEMGKSVTDVTKVNGGSRDRQYHVERLSATNMSDIRLTPFRYQLLPSLPVKEDDPARSMIAILAALLGGVVTRGDVLLNHVMMSRRQKMTFTGQQLV